MRIGFIGTGTIARAMVTGIANDGHTITVSNRGAAHAAHLANTFDAVTIAPNQTVLDQSDVIFLGLMAETAPDVLKTLRFRADHRVISVMAGATLDALAPHVAPATLDAIMIPFPNIAHGGSPILVRGDTALVNALFGARNTLFDLQTDAELRAYLSAQAVLSPAVKMISDAAHWLGDQTQDATKAEEFLRTLIASSLRTTPCATLLAALDTPGGYNQRLRDHMTKRGQTTALIDGLNALKTDPHDRA